MVVVGGSQRLLSLNPTTVMVVLLLGLWLLLGCDNYHRIKGEKLRSILEYKYDVKFKGGILQMNLFC